MHALCVQCKILIWAKSVFAITETSSASGAQPRSLFGAWRTALTPTRGGVLLSLHACLHGLISPGMSSLSQSQYCADRPNFLKLTFMPNEVFEHWHQRDDLKDVYSSSFILYRYIQFYNYIRFRLIFLSQIRIFLRFVKLTAFYRPVEVLENWRLTHRPQTSRPI